MVLVALSSMNAEQSLQLEHDGLLNYIELTVFPRTLAV